MNNGDHSQHRHTLGAPDNPDAKGESVVPHAPTVSVRVAMAFAHTLFEQNKLQSTVHEKVIQQWLWKVTQFLGASAAWLMTRQDDHFEANISANGRGRTWKVNASAPTVCSRAWQSGAAISYSTECSESITMIGPRLDGECAIPINSPDNTPLALVYLQASRNSISETELARFDHAITRMLPEALPSVHCFAHMLNREARFPIGFTKGWSPSDPVSEWLISIHRAIDEQYSQCMLWRVHWDDECMTNVATTGFDALYQADWSLPLNSALGTAVRAPRGHVTHINSISDNPHFLRKDTAISMSLREACAVPIFSSDDDTKASWLLVTYLFHEPSGDDTNTSQPISLPSDECLRGLALNFGRLLDDYHNRRDDMIIQQMRLSHKASESISAMFSVIHRALDDANVSLYRVARPHSDHSTLTAQIVYSYGDIAAHCIWAEDLSRWAVSGCEDASKLRTKEEMTLYGEHQVLSPSPSLTEKGVRRLSCAAWTTLGVGLSLQCFRDISRPSFTAGDVRLGKAILTGLLPYIWRLTPIAENTTVGKRLQPLPETSRIGGCDV